MAGSGTLFEDTLSSLQDPNTFMQIGSGAATGGMAGGGGGAILGATLGAAGGVASARQRRKAKARAEQAANQQRLESIAARNALVERNFQQRSKVRGEGLGGSGNTNLAPGQQKASNTGTSLLSSTQTNAPSLFGGSQ